MNPARRTTRPTWLPTQEGQDHHPPRPNSQRGIVGAIIVVCCGVGGVIAAVSSGDQDSASDSTLSSSASSNRPSVKQETPKTAGSKVTKQAAGLNTPVRDGKSEFVVTSVKCGKAEVGESFLAKKAQGSYCVVSLSVKNIGTKPQVFIDSNQKGFVGKSEYSPDLTATIAISGDQSTWINEINPGNAITGAIAFDLPVGAAFTSLKLHDSMFSGGVTVMLA